ncbi:MAG: twin-arginine translocation signal domain-containing protein, partial [Nitrospirales bacterium]|nr:twin-arginine translocation signal domain-containing protein [Nitrospirales bacterium]
MNTPLTHTAQPTLSRRQLLKACLVGGGLAVSGFSMLHWLMGPRLNAQTFIGQAKTYEADFAIIIRQGLQELGVTPLEIKGKRILLKPNLVEPHQSLSYINT